MNDSIFPFISTIQSSNTVDTDNTVDTELEEMKEYAYDYENNCLLLDQEGKHYFVYRNEALKIWIYKALRTTRYRHIAYTDDFGNEMNSLIGQSIDAEILKLEIKRNITEAIMFNPYIKAINNFKIDIEDTRTNISFEIESIYGNIDYKDELKEGV